MEEYNCLLLINFILLTLLPAALSNNDTNTTTGADNATAAHLTAVYGSTTTPNPNTLPQVVLTIVVISGCGLLGLFIAKLSDYCYDRRMATRDDISNASEYTKNILRTRLVVMKMKTDPPAEEDRNVKRAASAWIENTVNPKNTKESETDGDGKNDKADADVEKGQSEPSPVVMEDEVFSVAAPATPTINVIPSAPTEQPPPQTPSGPSPAVSPLPYNKVAPANAMPTSHSEMKRTPTMPSSNKEIKGMPPGGRGNALPPIAPRSDANSINQPIRSTR